MGTEKLQPPLRWGSHRERKLLSCPCGTGRLEKPRAMEGHNTRFFNSAPNPQSASELGAYEDMEISSWTPPSQGMITGQDSPAPHFILLHR